MIQYFYQGFIKAAQEAGLTTDEAVKLAEMTMPPTAPKPLNMTQMPKMDAQPAPVAPAPVTPMGIKPTTNISKPLKIK